MRGASSARLLILSLCLGAQNCHGRSERTLHDTEGRVFEASCIRSGECTLVQRSGEKRSDGKSGLVLGGSGRFVGVCDVDPGKRPESAADCRALLCKSDADCPPAHGLADGQCLDGYCADAAGSLDVGDAVMLCLAGTGLGRDRPRQFERYALAMNCGTPCRVPAPCRQP